MKQTLASELDHLEAHLHKAVASALAGRPETDLLVHDALAILDRIRGVTTHA